MTATEVTEAPAGSPQADEVNVASAPSSCRSPETEAEEATGTEARDGEEEASTSGAEHVVGEEDWSGYAAGALARVMFWPSLAWNLARTSVYPADYRWYTEVCENLLLGALPFHSMLEDFKEQGIGAVLTLNESFELFVTSEDYKELGIHHMHLPTIDFLFAPGVDDMKRAVSFIQENIEAGRRVYVHCKAGRGRSATVVVCFMVGERGMTPEEALAYVRKRRPQISLAPGQWSAVLDFYAACQGGPTESGGGDDRKEDAAQQPLNNEKEDGSGLGLPTPAAASNADCPPPAAVAT